MASKKVVRLGEVLAILWRAARGVFRRLVAKFRCGYNFVLGEIDWQKGWPRNG
jgi:hypothetical protein